MSHLGRPRLGKEVLTNAQKQARFRKSHPEYRVKATLYMRSWRSERVSRNGVLH